MVSFSDIVTTMFAPWLPIAGLAIGIMIGLVGSVYVIGSLLLNDKMKLWAKLELMEVFYSTIIILLLATSIPYLDGVIQGALGVVDPSQGGSGITKTYIRTGFEQYQLMDICGTQIAANPSSVYANIQSCHVRLGVWYLRELFDEAKDFAFDTYLDYMGKSMLAELTISSEYLSEKGGIFSFNPIKGFYSVGNGIRSTVFDWSIKLMMLTKFQETLLYFVATGLAPMMMIAGAVLRAATFTRRLGGLLLAAGLCLYYVFPAFYAFAALNMLEIKNTIRNNPQANPENLKDPSIANMIYITGDVAMPGAAGSRMSTRDARVALSNLEGQSTTDFLRGIENRNDPNSMPQYQVGGGQYNPNNLGQSVTVLQRTMNTIMSWLEAVKDFAVYDIFMDSAYLRNGPIDSLSRLTFWSVFFSFLALMATIAAIRSLSITLGGDIEIAGLTRLI